MKNIKNIIFIIAVVLGVVLLGLFTAFVLIPKMGVLGGLIVTLSLVPFISAVYIAKKP